MGAAFSKVECFMKGTRGSPIRSVSCASVVVLAVALLAGCSEQNTAADPDTEENTGTQPIENHYGGQPDGVSSTPSPDPGPDDERPSEATTGMGNDDSFGRPDYGAGRGENTSPYDVPGTSPSEVYD